MYQSCQDCIFSKDPPDIFLPTSTVLKELCVKCRIAASQFSYLYQRGEIHKICSLVQITEKLLEEISYKIWNLQTNVKRVVKIQLQKHDNTKPLNWLAVCFYTLFCVCPLGIALITNPCYVHVYVCKFMLFRISFLRKLFKILIVLCIFHIHLPCDIKRKQCNR
jgi:hypothetical protein